MGDDHCQFRCELDLEVARREAERCHWTFAMECCLSAMNHFEGVDWSVPAEGAETRDYFIKTLRHIADMVEEEGKGLRQHSPEEDGVE